MKHMSMRILSFLLSVVILIATFAGCAPVINQVEESTTEVTSQVETTSSEPSVEPAESVEATPGNADKVDSAAEVTYDPEVEAQVDSAIDELVEDKDKAIEEDKDLSTDGIASAKSADEDSVTDEGALEVDAVVEMENISYDGVNTGKGVNLLGKWQGITYYGQNDRRWANILYTSTGNRSQTIKASGCGPTSTAMIVSSSIGAITPPEMSTIYVKNGFRTANNGTAWAAMAFTADYFGFRKFYPTSSYSSVFDALRTDADKDGVSDYFVIVSCGPGLFTTGGHYIALMGDNGGTIRVHDPYMYWGKFTTASRKAANVSVSGNIAYVSESNFKKYANMKYAWVFSNDHKSTSKDTSGSNSSSASKPSKVNYTRYVATKSDILNVRKGPGKNYDVVGSLKKGTKVTVTQVDGSWSKIGKNRWVSSAYLSAVPVKSSSSAASISYKTKVNSTYKFKSNTKLYSKSNLSGTVYQYKAGTSAKVISHVSATVDYVYIAATGRKAYVNVSAFNLSSNSRSKTKSTVNQTKYLKSKTTLYSKSNLSGTQYVYLAGTQVKILKNVSSSVDYIQVIKTGRKAYVKTSAYK